MSISHYKIKYKLLPPMEDPPSEAVDRDIIISCRNSENIIDTFKEKIIKDGERYSIYDISMIICQGCISDCANQMAHMDIGGCLYQSSQ